MSETVTETATPGLKMLADLREQIFDGRLTPGERVPVRTVLEARYGTTPATVQKVFDKLAREGLIVARGSKGTFVSDAPPHLTRFALVFPYRDRPDRPWPHFWRALRDEAATEAAANGHALVFSYGNETHQDVEAYRQLVDDVENRRFAGLIFASKPFYMQGSPVLEAPDMPRVAITPEPMPPNVQAVTLGPQMLDRMLAHLRRHGRKRIAALTLPPMRVHVEETLRRHGLASPPYWVQTAVQGDDAGIRALTQLLMSAPCAQRPDGLMIADDNLVPAATAGLLDAGVNVPADVLVVAHANFPSPTPAPVATHRVGYDVREVLRACMQLLDTQRPGGEATGCIVVPVQERAEAPQPA